MKLFFTIIIILCSTFCATAQAPQGISYQLVVRDSSNALVKNSPVGVSLTILKSTASGQAVYVETHQDTTNTNGLLSLVLGRGTVSIGTFADIGWTEDAYYLKTEIDPAGGMNYGAPVVMRFGSSPTAYYANTADTAATGQYADSIAVRVSVTGDTLYLGNAGSFVVISGISPVRGGYVACKLDDQIVIQTVTSDSTGKVWMDRNLGASQVATASDDSLAYGDLYQWGRYAEGHQCRRSDTTSTLATSATPNSSDSWYGRLILYSSDPYDWLSTPNDDLWQGENGVNNPCPRGFRLPTDMEWQAEIDSWNTKNSAGAFASPLKLPAVGFRGSGGALAFVGDRGRYWSSSVSGSNARYLLFSSSEAKLSSYYRAHAYAVRCIRD